MAKRGAPSKYDPQYCEMVDDYLKTCGREQTQLPTIEGFGFFIGVPRSTMYDWREEHPDFSDTLNYIMGKQKEQLINDGIYGGKEVNATIVKLMLQNNHEMKERSEETGEKSINVNIHDYGSKK